MFRQYQTLSYLSLVEANACGTSAVAYNVPGLRDSIVDGVTGLLVLYGDAQALAEAILKRLPYVLFSRYYKPSKILRGILFVSYGRLKLLLTNLEQEHLIYVHGCRLSTIPNDQGISAELIVFKTHEPLTTAILKKELKKGWVCLDAGANIGYYTLLMRKLVGSEGKVIAIEPSPLSFSYLKKNIRQNGFSDIDTFNFALTSYDGVVPFLMDRRSNLSRVVNKNDHPLDELVVDVPARSLDSFADQYHFDKLDFIRMDVEGHEIEILQGGLHTIERFKPSLFIEVHKGIVGTKNTINFLQSLQNLGYDVKYYIPRELDMPLIGSMKDIQRIPISRLIEKLSNDMLSGYFHLLLVN